MQGRLLKGILGGTTILLMFLIGVLIGGHIYAVRDTSEGLLSSLFGLCDLGSGVLYLVSRFAGFASSESLGRATAEYGSVFLMVAGLLNLIMALDAFDIRVGRKS
jgi:drug/metabolite transporter superfamily protein YnfA